MPVDFFENGLLFHCRLAETELREYSDFHRGVEELWQRRDEDLQSEVSELLKEFPEAEHDDIIDSHSWDLHCNQLKYPSIHRAALIVAIYAFIEAHLNSLCEIIRESTGSRFGLKDISGQGIERARLYLSRAGGFDFANISGLSYLKNIGLVRNVLVHGGGELPDDTSAPVCKFVASTSGIAGNPGGLVRIDAQFIYEMAEKFVSLFQEMDLEVQAFVKRVDKSEA